MNGRLNGRTSHTLELRGARRIYSMESYGILWNPMKSYGIRSLSEPGSCDPGSLIQYAGICIVDPGLWILDT